MITITTRERTYKPSKDSAEMLFTLINGYIKLGYLEEVKENIEPLPDYKAFTLDGIAFYKKDKQIELLTTTLNKIIRKLK